MAPPVPPSPYSYLLSPSLLTDDFDHESWSNYQITTIQSCRTGAGTCLQPFSFIEFCDRRPSGSTAPFDDADAMAKWLPPNGFTGRVHHADVRVGGTYKMSFTNFTSAKATPSAVNTWSSFQTNGFAGRIGSTTRTWRARWW